VIVILAVYADDIILISASIYELQNMINICCEEASKINMIINSKKCAVLRIGLRYKAVCVNVSVAGMPVQYVNSAKYLGVMLQSHKQFRVDLHYVKSRFYKSFNSIFHRAGRVRNELVTLHLVSAYCKPQLLYVTESLNLSATEKEVCNILGSVLYHTYSMFLVRILILCVILWMTSR